MTAHFTVRVTDWAHDAAGLREVRRAVFIVEQQIDEHLEWDEFDATSRHALAEGDDGAAIGCGRLLPDGHIGRMAVLRDWRGHGVGSALLLRLIALARESGHPVARLNSQVRAMPFYAGHGFVPEGGEYDEAGIPHRAMALVF
jgi:predicted GNAT family N-acyltransferase